jgi:hypothetical protein
MKAIKTKNTMKQLIISLSMLLFLFTACNLYSQQVRVKPTEKVSNKNLGASVNTKHTTQLGSDVLQSIPVQYDRNTMLSYSIPREMDVEIKVYNKNGLEIKTLVSEMQIPGTYKINLSELKNGTYFYQLTIGSFSEIKKIILAD